MTPKIAICAPSHNFVALYLRNIYVSTIGKKLLNSNMSSTCPHNMANFGPLTAEIGSGVWGTSTNFNGFRVLASLLHRRRSPKANQTLHDVWPSPGLLYFRRLLPPDRIMPGAKFTLRPSLAFSYIGSVTARTPAAGVSQTLRRGTRNGITELSQRAPPIFGRAAITLGISPHSSYYYYYYYSTCPTTLCVAYAYRSPNKNHARAHHVGELPCLQLIRSNLRHQLRPHSNTSARSAPAPSWLMTTNYQAA